MSHIHFLPKFIIICLLAFIIAGCGGGGGNSMGQSGVVSYNVSNDALTVQDVTLRGTVTVESAGGHILSVEGAKVTAVPYFANKGKTVSVTTNDLGEYQIPLQPGRYTVYAENEVLNSAHISIMVNENIERNFELTECLDPPPPPPF